MPVNSRALLRPLDLVVDFHLNHVTPVRLDSGLYCVSRSQSLIREFKTDPGILVVDKDHVP